MYERIFNKKATQYTNGTKNAKKSNTRITAIALLCLFLLTANIFAQKTQDTDNKSDKNIKASARVNPVTLAMEFLLPLSGYPGRAGNSKPISLRYSSKIWTMQKYNFAQVTEPISDPSFQWETFLTSNLEAKFGERTIAGWTHSLNPPSIIVKYERYDEGGNIIPLEFENIIENPGSNVAPNLPNEDLTAPDFEPYEPPIEPIPGCGEGVPVGICPSVPAEVPEFPRTDTVTVPPIVTPPVIPQPTPTPPQRHIVKRIRIQMPNGSTTEFRKDDKVYKCSDPSDPCAPNEMGTFLSVDGSGMKLETGEMQPNGQKKDVLYLPGGGKYFFSVDPQRAFGIAYLKAEKYIDVNGNVSTFDVTQQKWTDTMGRLIESPLPDPFIENNLPVGTQTYQLEGLNNQNQTYSIKWERLKDGSNGALENLSDNLRPIGDDTCANDAADNPLTNALFTSAPIEEEPSGTTKIVKRKRVCNRYNSDAVFNPVVMSEVTLPNGQKYKFKYNVYGEITKIIYPTGAYERFEYAQVPMYGSNADDVYKQGNRGVVKRWVSEDGTNEIQYWQYSADHTRKVTEIAPDGMKTERILNHSPESWFGFEEPTASMPNEVRTFGTDGRWVSRSLTEWTVKGPWTGGFDKAKRDARVSRSVSIIFEQGQSVALATLSETEYDENGNSDPEYFSHLNVKQTKTYHYKSLSLNTAQTADIATIAALFSSSDLATVSETDYSYDANYKARGIIGLPSETRALNPTNLSDVLGKTQIKFDEAAYPILNSGSTTGYEAPTGANANLRGNATTNRTWIKESNTWIETHAQYDNFGNLRKAWDAKGNVAETQYSSTYKFAYPTLAISTVPDPSGINGSSTAFQTTTTYDLTTGLVLSATDANGLTSTTEYNDPLLRPTAIVSPNGARTETTYNDTPNNIWIKTRSQFDTSVWVESTAYADNLGRAIKAVKKDVNGDIITETEYDDMGRVERVTNPYRIGQTKLWSLTTYDEVGRVKETFTPVVTGQGQSLGISEYGFSTQTGYVGTFVVGIDASGRKMRSITNALGQLVRVDEATNFGGTSSSDLGAITAPNQATYYTYDVFGNMVKVQQGSQYRHFKYDALGRLIRVRQPEQEVNTALNTSGNPYNNQWTAGFTYDDNGNLLTTTDAKGVTITNTYDNLNRVKTRTYSDGTPTVTYKYDNLTKAKGALIETSNVYSTSKTTQFDQWGRPLTYQQITDGVTYTSSYVYNLSGALVQETYPTGRIIKHDFDLNGDISKIYGRKDANSADKDYANNFAYTPDGRIEKLQIGNGLWENAKFNNRLQVTELGLGISATNLNLWKVNYEYGELNTNGTVNTLKNTGNIAKQTITIGNTTPYVQTYKYDALYRITEAKETSASTQNWKQTFGYDRYGNRTSFSQIVGSTTLPIDNITRPTISSATNRFNPNQGYLYDKAGNLIMDAEGRTFTFNGDNKQTLVKDSQSQTIGSYFYDGDGKRIKKVTQTETTVFVYSGGKLVTEYSSQTPSATSTKYIATDTLGSIRAITDENANIVSRRDFMPFGEELYAGTPNRSTTQKFSTNGDDVRQKFTGYERDKETGLDFAEARYYKNNHGRFTAVDPLLASGKSANPQTFNRYVYVMNNPLAYTDPDGLQVSEEKDGYWASRGGKTADGSDGITFYKFGSEVEQETLEAVWGGDKFTKWTGNDFFIFADNTAIFLGNNESGAGSIFSTKNITENTLNDLVKTQHSGGRFSSEQREVLLNAWTRHMNSNDPDIQNAKVVSSIIGPGLANGAKNSFSLLRNKFFGRTNFFTVQSTDDISRLKSGGDPFPTAPNRSALGDGVYSFGNKTSAQNYLTRLESHGANNLKIQEFSINNFRLNRFKSLNVDSLKNPTAWMNRNSKLFGGKPNHGLQYIQRGTQFGTEHFFHKSVIGKIKWKN